MPFRPTLHSTLTIDNKVYVFYEHPVAKGMPYGQTGRRATVYKVADQNNKDFALKVFTKAFRSSSYVEGAQQLHSFSSLPGLQVCARQVVAPEKERGLVEKYPELTYAVLMPWAEGETWFDVVSSQRPVTVNTSHEMALHTATIFAGMEQRGLAHCDISGPNVLVNFDLLAGSAHNGHHPVTLVDVEEMFGPGLNKPAKLPAGTDGYAHRIASQGLWGGTADRFAGAILLVEMLTWHDERVRRISLDDHYFAQDKMQTACDRYQLVLQVLREQGKSMAADLFARSWFSSNLTECPSFSEWYVALNGGGPPTSVGVPNFLGGTSWRPIQHPTVSVSVEQVKPMMLDAAQEGRWQDVLTLAPQVLQLSPADSEALTLQTRAQRLIQLDQAIQQTWQVAVVSGMVEDWDNCIRLITTAQYQAEKVERYENLKREAEKEKEISLKAAAFERIIADKDWNEAERVKEKLPKSHPLIAALIARLDREREHENRIKEQLQKTEDAISNRMWDDAIQLAREGLILDPANGLFTKLQDEAKRERKLDEELSEILIEVESFVKKEEWQNAEEGVVRALVLQPKRESLLRNLEEIRNWKDWAKRLEGVQSQYNNISAKTLLSKIADIPAGFSDVDQVRDLLEEIILWRDEIKFAQKKYSLNKVDDLLKGRPAPSLDVSKEVRWLEAERELESSFSAMCGQYQVRELGKFIEKLGQRHPLQIKGNTWLKEYETHRARLEEAQKRFDAVDVLGLLSQLPVTFPDYSEKKTWAEAELDAKERLEEARKQRNVEIVEQRLSQLSPKHPLNKEFRDWIKEEKGRKKAVQKARENHNLVSLEQLLADIPEDCEEYSDDWKWLRHEVQIESSIDASLSTFSIDDVTTLLKTLDKKHSRFIELETWLVDEKKKRSAIKKAQKKFAFDEVERLYRVLPDQHPFVKSASSWLLENRTLFNEIKNARSSFDYDKVMTLLEKVPDNFPEYTEMKEWALKELKRYEEALAALQEEDLPKLKGLLQAWPEVDPYKLKLKASVFSLEAQKQEIAEAIIETQKAIEVKNWTSVRYIVGKLKEKAIDIPQELEDNLKLAQKIIADKERATQYLYKSEEALRQKKWELALEYAHQVRTIYSYEPKYENAFANMRKTMIVVAKKAELKRSWREARKIWLALKTAGAKYGNDHIRTTGVETKSQEQIISKDILAVRTAIRAGDFVAASPLVIKLLNSHHKDRRQAGEEIMTQIRLQAEEAQAKKEWKQAKILWEFMKSIRPDK